MIKAFIEAPQKFYRELERADKARVKNAFTAVRVEGFKIYKMLREQIESGTAGNRAPLTELAKRHRGERTYNLPRLFMLGKKMRYGVDEQAHSLSVHIGFLDKVTGRRGRSVKLSKAWIRIAEEQQEGKSFSADEMRRRGNKTHRQYLARLGHKRDIGYSIGTFALKAATKTLHTPASPIIEPFWRWYQPQAWRNIEQNYERKMRGERI